MANFWIISMCVVAVVLFGNVAVFVKGAPAGIQDGGKQIICYYSSWSGYRPGVGTFTIDDIPINLCTHVIYAFIGLNNRTWELLVLDPTNDITKGGYRRFTSLKKRNPNLKTLISVGGWVEGGKKYSEMAAKADRRKIFVNSVVDFIKWFNFDGIDLDWEFPGSADRDGHAEDKANFLQLVKELRDAFDKEGWGWMLTAVVPIMHFRVENGYEVAKLSTMLDHIHLLTYDLRGNWTGFSDIHTPLRPRQFDSGDYEGVNMRDGAELWEKLGAPREKLTIGLALYGRTYTLADPAVNGLHSRLNVKRTAGNPGPFTKANGTLAYYEICEMQRDPSWDVRYDEIGDSPYMVKGDQWVGYDDRHSLIEKVKFVVDKGYAGVSIWSVDLDDFRGVCGEPRVLLNSIYKQMTGRSAHTAQSRTPTTKTEVFSPSTSKIPITAPTLPLHTKSDPIVTTTTFSELLTNFEQPQHPSQDLGHQSSLRPQQHPVTIELATPRQPVNQRQHDPQTLSFPTFPTLNNHSPRIEIHDEFDSRTPPSLSIATAGDHIAGNAQDHFRSTVSPVFTLDPRDFTTIDPSGGISGSATEPSSIAIAETPDANVNLNTREEILTPQVETPTGFGPTDQTAQPGIIFDSVTAESQSPSSLEEFGDLESVRVTLQPIDISTENGVIIEDVRLPELPNHQVEEALFIPLANITESLTNEDQSSFISISPGFEKDGLFRQEAPAFGTEEILPEIAPQTPAVVGPMGEINDLPLEVRESGFSANSTAEDNISHVVFSEPDVADVIGNIPQEPQLIPLEPQPIPLEPQPIPQEPQPILQETQHVPQEPQRQEVVAAIDNLPQEPQHEDVVAAVDNIPEEPQQEPDLPSTSSTTKRPTFARPPLRRTQFGRQKPSSRQPSRLATASPQSRGPPRRRTTVSPNTFNSPGSRRPLLRRRPTTAFSVPISTGFVHDYTDFTESSATMRTVRPSRRTFRPFSRSRTTTKPFDNGITSTDFLRMDATTEFIDGITQASRTEASQKLPDVVDASTSKKPQRRLRTKSTTLATTDYDWGGAETSPATSTELITQRPLRGASRFRRPGTILRGNRIRSRQNLNGKDRFHLPTISSDTEISAEGGSNDEVFVRFSPSSTSRIVEHASGGAKAVRSLSRGSGNGFIAGQFRSNRRSPSTRKKVVGDVDAIGIKAQEEAPSCETRKYHSHPLCDKYWACMHGTAVIKECDMGLLWNPQTEICDWAMNVAREDCE